MTEKQKDRKTERPKDRKTKRQTIIQRLRHEYTRTHRQKDRWTGGHKDRETFFGYYGFSTYYNIFCISLNFFFLLQFCIFIVVFPLIDLLLFLFCLFVLLSRSFVCL
jgi:hypothetical protein